MNYLSTNIKYLRQKHNLTQEQLANIVEKSRVLVSQWEADERDITTEDIIKLSNYFNIPMDSLVGSDLRLEQQPFSELDVLFSKHKDKLTPGDEAIIKAIIEQRMKEIDKQLDGE